MRIETKAALAAGNPLEKWSYDAPELKPWECIVQVRSCGICHSDLHMIDNDWGFSRYPLVPGHEAIGEVIEAGNQVTHLKPGARVGIGWQRSACLQCMDCLRGNENLCVRSKGVISHGYGGFASHVVMDSRFCFPIPAGIETNEAGPLLCGGATVYSALRSAGMTSGQEIGVIGVGGLGHMAVQFAAKLGNRVTIFTTSQDKAEEAAKLGATDAVLTGDRDPQTDRRFDIILNTVPAPLNWEAYLNLLASDGTLSFVGVPAEPASIPINALLQKRRRIMASAIGSRWVIQDMLRTAEQHGVRPQIEAFPLMDANLALDKVRKNTVRYRAVLVA